jgi:hypothetical protein
MVTAVAVVAIVATVVVAVMTTVSATVRESGTTTPQNHTHYDEHLAHRVPPSLFCS